MHAENTLKKSDKKFVRLEKGRIRNQFLDVKKQEEMIDALYKRFEKKPAVTVVKDIKVAEDVKPAKVTKEVKPLEAKKEIKKEHPKKDKIKAKK
ncbi:MAG: hypothetical protein Q7S10_01205 [bacterium]|nr:hypothetical protein [bacterium]